MRLAYHVDERRYAVSLGSMTWRACDLRPGKPFVEGIDVLNLEPRSTMVRCERDRQLANMGSRLLTILCVGSGSKSFVQAVIALKKFEENKFNLEKQINFT